MPDGGVVVELVAPAMGWSTIVVKLQVESKRKKDGIASS